MIQNIDHIEILVLDLESHVRFFEALGFRVLARTEHHTESVELHVPGTDYPVIELHRLEGQEVPGINHIAFRCDDVRRTYDELTARGVRFEDRPEDFGPPAYVPETRRWVANLRAPDGMRLQLTEARAPKDAP